jgi:hypothetical protein
MTSAVLSFSGLKWFRLTFALIVSLLGLFLFLKGVDEHSLDLAVLLLGVFAGAHLVIEKLWVGLPSSGSGSSGGSDLSGAFREAAAIYISTPAVVLGLLAVFAEPFRSTTLQVAAVALAVTILLGIVLHGLVVLGTPTDEARLTLLGYLFNLLLWALAFGALAIALAIVYQ